MLAGWPTCYDWACCPKGTSIPRPSGRYAMSCANARTWCVSTRPMCSVCKTSWRGIPVCASVSSGFTSSPRQTFEGLLPEAAQVLAVTSSLAVLDCLRQQIKTLEKAVTTSLQHTPAYEQLLTRRWHRDDFGPDDRAGNRRYWPLSDGGQLCLVLSLCHEYENQQRQAQRPGQRQKWQPVSRVGLYGGSAVCHPLQPDGAAVLPTETGQKPSAWSHGRPWPINCRGLVITSCETSCPLRSTKLLAEVEPPGGLGLETGRKSG